VRDSLAEGRIPYGAEDIKNLAPGLTITQKRLSPFGESAIYQLVAQPGGGFGDPITREPVLVVADLRSGRVSPEDVERIYGLVASESDEGFDLDATERKRKELLAQRIADSRPPREPCRGQTTLDSDVTHVLAGVALTPGRSHLACAHCGQHLAAADGNFRLGCRELEQTLPSLSPLFDDPEPEIGEPIVFRQYYCPGCGLALDNDICKPTDEPYPSFLLL
jgi:N-methylhydantoinase B